MQEYQWTPQQISSITLGQMVSLWDPEGKPKEMSKAEQLALLNKKRAKKGLPPVKPREGHGDRKRACATIR